MDGISGALSVTLLDVTKNLFFCTKVSDWEVPNIALGC